MNTKKLVLTALTVTLLGSGAVYAKGGNNGNSADHGARGNDNGRNERGVIASDLKWRNAAHASAQAFLNANPDSAVGLLAALANASSALDEAYAAVGVDLGDPADDAAEVEALIAAYDPVPRPSSEVQSEIDLLLEGDPLLSALEGELAIAEEYEALVALSDALAAEAAAEDGVALDELDDASITALWELLEGK